MGGADDTKEAAISRNDHIWVAVLLTIYVVANIAVTWSALRA